MLKVPLAKLLGNIEIIDKLISIFYTKSKFLLKDAHICQQNILLLHRNHY